MSIFMEVFLCVRDVSWVPSKAVAFAIDPSTWKKLHQINGNVIVVQQHHQQQQDKVVLEGWDSFNVKTKKNCLNFFY